MDNRLIQRILKADIKKDHRLISEWYKGRNTYRYKAIIIDWHIGREAGWYKKGWRLKLGTNGKNIQKQEGKNIQGKESKLIQKENIANRYSDIVTLWYKGRMADKEKGRIADLRKIIVYWYKGKTLAGYNEKMAD